ncbi:MAG: tetratricopeptide repeat protein [Verrucomicrobiae bacterium]|nr:tetratricopeptide repeat protein [Verrucomicrobiae bacterium]NNJ43245.1 tetratricopeptide repeat protein [Akkermansiaceae bacterium]
MKNPSAKRLALFLSVITLAIITAWTYHPVHSFGYIDYDDPAYIADNPYVNSGLDVQNIQWAFTFEESKGLPVYDGIQNLYHPITWISHMIDVEVFGVASPGAQHIVNLAIHLIAGVLLFFIFLKLLKNHVVALATAILFCIHPLHVESVAWLSERKDTLSALFAFASILSYQFYAEKQSRSYQVSSVVFFVLALLAKPSVVILPGILMLLDQYQRHQMNKLDVEFLKKQCVHKLPWIIPSIVAALAAIYFQQGGSHGYFMHGMSLGDRIVLIPTRLSYYLYHTFSPTGLSFHYAPPPFSAPLISACCSIGLIVLTVFCYRVRMRFPLAIFALLWFYVCILPMSGIVHVGTSFIADRYTYLAIIGIFACVSAALIKYLPQRLAYIALTLIVLTCVWLAKQQTQTWKDSYALFSNAIEAQPRSAIGYVNLGAKYKLDGQLDKAAPLFEKAIEISPHDYIAYHNLAQIHLAQKQWSRAERSLLMALKNYEHYAPSMKSLAKLYLIVPEMYHLEKALNFTKRYNTAVKERDPQMLGFEIKILLKLNRSNEAKAQALKLRRLPGNAEM